MRILVAIIWAYLAVGVVYCVLNCARILKEIKKKTAPPAPTWERTLLWVLLPFLAVILSPIELIFQLCGEKTPEPQKTPMDALMENPIFREQKQIYDIMAEMCADGCDTDQLPNAHGEFGYDASNPIPTKTVQGSIVYLSKLRAPDGTKVHYERRGSVTNEVCPHPIDLYDISHEDGTKLATLYLSPYQKKTSEKAPRHFI